MMDTTTIREKAEQWKREHPDSLWRFASYAEILAMCEEIDRLRASVQPRGCICPGTLAAGCHAPMCPRRPLAVN